MNEKKRRVIEREFGVPIAGDILDSSRWTQTALKKLAPGILDWQALFGREAPRVLDLGCGNGRFLLGSAVWRPDRDHLGIDPLPVVIRYATRRGNQRGLTNIRFAVIDAAALLEAHIEPGTISEIHCYHPQPYDDPSQTQRRLLTPRFLAKVHQSLVAGGSFFLQTDHAGYWSYLREVVPVFFEFEERFAPWPDAPKGRTRREIIAMRRGMQVFRGSGKARSLRVEDALERARMLPFPNYAADRRLRELDEIERKLDD